MGVYQRTTTIMSTSQGGKDIRVEALIEFIEGLGPDFNPVPAIDLLRNRAGDTRSVDHIIADMLEGMWDELQRLRFTLDQSKGTKGSPKPKRKK